EAPLEFSEDALAEAETATPAVPDLDLPDGPFFPLDPAGARDPDQARHLERDGSGFQVRYAIADVPGFVTAGGAVDREARQRGQTLYLADGTIPLHPLALSADRASLLADQERPALVWTFALGETGAVTQFRLE